MEITFTVSREDYWRFSRYVSFGDPKLRRGIYGWVFVAFFLSITTMWLVFRSSGLALAFGLPLGAVALAAGYRGMKGHVMSYPSGRPGLLGEHTITLLPDGIRERTEVNDGFHKWAGIWKIEEDGPCVYLFIDTGLAHIIPKRAFPNIDECQAFLELAKKYWRDARGLEVSQLSDQ